MATLPQGHVRLPGSPGPATCVSQRAHRTPHPRTGVRTHGTGLGVHECAHHRGTNRSGGAQYKYAHVEAVVSSCAIACRSEGAPPMAGRSRPQTPTGTTGMTAPTFPQGAAGRSRRRVRRVASRGHWRRPRVWTRLLRGPAESDAPPHRPAASCNEAATQPTAPGERQTRFGRWRVSGKQRRVHAALHARGRVAEGHAAARLPRCSTARRARPLARQACTRSPRSEAADRTQAPLPRRHHGIRAPRGRAHCRPALDRAAGAGELPEDHHLVDVVARESVRCGDDHAVDLPRLHRVAQSVGPQPGERGPRVAVV